MSRRLTIATAIVILGVAWPTVSSADTGGSHQTSAGGHSSGGSASVVVSTNHATETPNNSPYSSCETSTIADWLTTQITTAATNALQLNTPTHHNTYQTGIGIADCHRLDGTNDDTFLIGLPTPTATETAALAAATLTINPPTITTSPPANQTQLTGIPTWFWTNNTHPLTATATLPGITATVTATPTTLHLNLGDNTTLTCTTPTTPYNPLQPTTTQHSNCTHTYDQPTHLTATATLTWQLTWTATNGQTGTLPNITRTTTIPLHIQEAQATTD